MKNFLILTTSILLFGGHAVNAAPRAIELPEETAKLKPSDHPGYSIALQKCAICHSADYINLQPPGMNLNQWTAEVGKMQHAYGAPITDDEVKLIGAYLATTYGSEKSLNIQQQSANKADISKETKKVDAKTLLQNNACLSCHAIDTKVVGPAYHEVAVRYRHDQHALETIMAHIKSGGSGKWGNVPMPPFPTLTDVELKALAEFVLAQ